MHHALNATACAELFEEVNFTDTKLVLSISVLAVIDIIVIIGNCLVIGAVYCSSKLRSATNLFIVSLAAADLLVGIAVLPFSATWEVFKVWIFGNIWCQVWLAVDVWMCTASILNLCAISFDRYVAVTRPIMYPSIMSHSRAKILITGVWILSFVICFPPLVGWSDSKSGHSSCSWKCELTNETGYVIYSALGSFYLPMFVMLFFYWRIYRAAIRTTRAINKGFKTTKGSKRLGKRFDEHRLTLRIHRGRGGSSGRHESLVHSTESNNTTTTTESTNASPIISATPRHEKVKISVSYPSSENISPTPCSRLMEINPKFSTKQESYSINCPVNGKGLFGSDVDHHGSENHLTVQRHGFHRRSSIRRSSWSSCESANERAAGPTASTCNDNAKPRTIPRRRRNIKVQVKRFRVETKAAKTLGIIVGAFIVCWLPFFTIYLLRAFCPDCVSPITFSVLFWLGYCNSAINPLIYALFSKDFRFAFKKIICKCFCKDTERKSKRSSRGSDVQGKQLICSNFNNQVHGSSFGDESDLGEDSTCSR